jgi:hypothetical protein
VRRLALLLGCLALVAACSSAADEGDSSATDPTPPATTSPTTGQPTTPGGTPTTGAEQVEDDHGDAGPAPKPKPLRPGERFVNLAMPEAYTPSAPYGVGTDDYRCFLLDPHFTRKQFVTGVNVLPGNPDVVHHVILFRVDPGRVADAQETDAEEPGQGWTCFGDAGVRTTDTGLQLDNAPWIGAWAPGGGESMMGRDMGIPLDPGSRIIMQVHYNLLAGTEPDVSSTQLRVRSGNADLEPLETVLMPAPVELPCRPRYADGPLCDRAAALEDVVDRFGPQASWTAAGLQLLCGGNTQDPPAGPVQSCDRIVSSPMTIHAVAGHMHLLGRSISIVVNPDTPRARTILDIPVWDFDNQGAKPLATPVRVQPLDTIRVTCRHTQRLRDLLPAFEGQPDRYVVWGEGTTDEMCLGILLVTKP